ncbi:ABC transporter ATP-binding protein [Mycoplasmopsis hyopharyngis]|uniref:ABC transporter ATP-binding protein n=1 Tax=Mycoplasmopsis hyopharyngis TaxID=29558 RepID=UPI003873425C
MFRVLKYLPKNVKVLIAISTILALFDPLLFMILPFLTKQFFQIIANPLNKQINFLGIKIVTSLDPILVLSLMTFSFSILIFAVMFLGFFISGKMSILAEYHLRKKLFNHIINLSIGDIEKISYSTIITRFSNDINKISNGLMTITRSVIVSPGFVVFGTIFSIIVSPSLSLSLAIIIPLLAINALVLVLKIFPLYRKENVMLDQLNSLAKEDINNITLIKSYNLEERQLQRYQLKNNDYIKIMKNEMNYGVIIWKIVDFIIGLGSPLIFGIIGLNLGDFNSTSPEKIIGSVYQFNIYVAMISHGVVRSFFTMNWVFRTSVSSKRFDEIMTKQSLIPIVVSDKKVENSNIKFENVSFSYNENKVAIKDANFEIKENTFVGIVGKAGSGKSTLIKLLTKQYLPNQGSIFVDHKNINEIDTKDFYKNISLVFQNPKILSGTVKTNIDFSNEQDSQKEWLDKVKQISCANYIDDFEQMYDFKIQQRGKNLSGGQKQRLAIAQAIIKKPKILILDDATNSLDNATDAKVIKNIRKEFNNSTLIMISQRISSIKEADQILMLDDGRIVAKGTHQELLKNNQYYQELFLSQEGNYEK